MTENKRIITYTVGNRYETGSYNEIEPYSTLTKTCEIKEGEDWKQAAENLQNEVHALLGDENYLEKLKAKIRQSEIALEKYASVLQRADTRYNEMKDFMTAQGLGEKMPNSPCLPEQLNELIKSLRPATEVEVVEEDDDYDDDDVI